MWKTAAVLLLFTGISSAQLASGQAAASDAAAMPPSEAYQYAIAPFNNARAQPNDLTDADRWALGITIDRATKACSAIPDNKLPSLPAELLAMGKLCILGQIHDRARQALVAYLELPKPPEPETARLLLVRAYLGLKSISSAESQVDSLLSEFPYDANIHYAIDQIVDAAEGTDPANEDILRRLNEQQLPHTLEALHGSGSITTADKSATVFALQLFDDALRVASQQRADGKQKEANALLAELSGILSDAKYAQSAQLPPMTAALKRYGMPGTILPERLHAKAISGAITVPQTLLLRGKPTILLPVVLWAPSSIDVVRNIANELTKAHTTTKIYAVTSVEANVGEGTDKPTAELMKNLDALQEAFPNVPLLLLPSAELDQFIFDSYPGGVLVDSNGVIRYLHTLDTPGSQRLLVNAALQHMQNNQP